MVTSGVMWVINMFMGEFKHTLDAKGRLTLPSKIREKYEETVVVTKGFDGCLSVYTHDEWQKMYEKLQSIPNTKKDARTFVRLLTAKAAECEIDKSGRINLPRPLIDEGRLTKDCIVVGAGNHVEIWDAIAWHTYCEEQDSKFEEISENLTDFMI